MATHSSVLAWRIPWTEEPGGLQSIGSHTVRHNWGDLACTHKLSKNNVQKLTCLLNSVFCEATFTPWGLSNTAITLFPPEWLFFCCAMGCVGILVPQLRIEPVPPAVEAQIPNLRPCSTPPTLPETFVKHFQHTFTNSLFSDPKPKSYLCWLSYISYQIHQIMYVIWLLLLWTECLHLP